MTAEPYRNKNAPNHIEPYRAERCLDRLDLPNLNPPNPNTHRRTQPRPPRHNKRQLNKPYLTNLRRDRLAVS